MLVFKHAHRFINSTAYKDLYNDEVLYDLLHKMLVLDNFIVLLDGDKGMLAGTCTPFLFGNKLVASEIGWWVEPEYRNSGVGKQLVDAFEEWAKEKNCDMIVMVSIDDSVGKYYEKTGYSLVERMYLKEI